MTPEEVLDCFEVRERTYGNLFVLGCLEPRVTIHSQQVRAANLVWALSASGRLRTGDSIGIIGAGFAGLTAGVAAQRLGFEPTIFELQERPLYRQAVSSRKIHPRIYDWPSPGWNQGHALPFMCWTAGKAQGAVSTIEAELTSIRGLRILYSTEVRDFRFEGGCWRVSTRDRKGNPKVGSEYPLPFTALILAIGFGRENEQPSYWHLDSFDDRSEAPRWVVGGLGDGALVDAGRLRLQDDDGYFALLDKIAERTPEPVREQLIELERFVENLGRATQARTPTSSRGNIVPVDSPNGPADHKRDIPLLLDDGLRRILQNVHLLEPLRRLVVDARRTDTWVKLVGRRPAPYTLEASLLNRWVVALLLAYDREDDGCGFAFVAGALNTAGSKHTIQRSEGGEIDVTAWSRLRRFGSARPLRASEPDFPWCAWVYAAFEGNGNRSRHDSRTPQWPAGSFGEIEPSRDLGPTSGPRSFTCETWCYFVVEDCQTAEVWSLAKTNGEAGFGLYLCKGDVSSQDDPDARAAETAWERRIGRQDFPRRVYRVRVFDNRAQEAAPGAEFMVDDMKSVGTPELVYTRPGSERVNDG